MTNTVFDTVTHTIIKQLEEGANKADFILPWNGLNTMPSNAFSNKEYRGINVFALWIAAIEKNYSNSKWATFKQWRGQSCTVRKGEKGTAILFWIFPKENTEDEETIKNYYGETKHYNVFNVEQVEGDFATDILKNTTIDDNPLSLDFTSETATALTAFIKDTKVDVHSGATMAYYSPNFDYIMLPKMEKFIATKTSTQFETYASTLLHEVGHWTGHKSRLDRDLVGPTKQKEYAYEELVAELFAALMCCNIGVTSTPREDHAQYLDHWLSILKQDKNFLISAASKAQKAVDYVYGLQNKKA